jgi:hypothetical protein
MKKILLGMTAAGVLLVACGGTTIIESPSGTSTGTPTGTSTGTNTGTSTGAGASTGVGASTTTNTSTSVGSFSSSSGAGGSPPSECPGSQPQGGSACSAAQDGLRCTYGDSVRPDCRDVFLCTGGSWQTTGNTCITPTDCPASEPSSTTQCQNQGDVCTYGDDICYCGCGGGVECMAPFPWSCQAPPGDGCPSLVPNDGTACPGNVMECDYGDPCDPSGAVVDCTGGYWRWNQMIACAGAASN